jgi:hypothetical protein
MRGKQTELGLGSPALVSLAEACKKALANPKLAREGGDPLAAKREAAHVMTLKEAAWQRRLKARCIRAEPLSCTWGAKLSTKCRGAPTSRMLSRSSSAFRTSTVNPRTCLRAKPRSDASGRTDQPHAPPLPGLWPHPSNPWAPPKLPRSIHPSAGRGPPVCPVRCFPAQTRRSCSRAWKQGRGSSTYIYGPVLARRSEEVRGGYTQTGALPASWSTRILSVP